MNWLDYFRDYQLFTLPYRQTLVKAAIAQRRATLYQSMRRRWAQYTEPLTPRGDRLKVGFISPHFYRHSGAAWVKGWLQHLTPEIEVSVYHLGDRCAQAIRERADHWVQLPRQVGYVASAVQGDRLHMLIYPDIGLHPISAALACLRLAPVQATAWGHPVTSGLPSVDYFLSGELIEPAGGDEHYTERLIRLAGVGFVPELPVMPAGERSAFGLAAKAVVFLCTQNPLKYRPEHDWLYPAIATGCPQAKFVFLQGHPIQHRLPRSFVRAHCVFVPWQSQTRYRELVSCGDVWLDPLEWSGGNGTLEAIAAGVPVVTLPGATMRGRVSAGLLQQLGTTNPIAQDTEHYLKLAIALGSAQQKAAIAPEGNRRWIQSVIDLEVFLLQFK